MASEFTQALYDAVSKIPRGKVSTYGQLAFLIGHPRASRIVGAAMARVPESLSLPCHRVIYGDGRLCCHQAFGGIQRRLLEQEGVTFLEDGRVDLKKHLWNTEPEEGPGA